MINYKVIEGELLRCAQWHHSNPRKCFRRSALGGISQIFANAFLYKGKYPARGATAVMGLCFAAAAVAEISESEPPEPDPIASFWYIDGLILGQNLSGRISVVS